MGARWLDRPNAPGWWWVRYDHGGTTLVHVDGILASGDCLVAGERRTMVCAGTRYHWAEPPPVDGARDPEDERIGALEAELARLRAEHEAPGLLWYAYDAECGHDTYPTAAQAKAAAEASIEHARDHDGWPEEVDQIEWGRLIPYERAVQTDYVAAEDDETGRCAREGFSHLCNYELRSVRS